MGRNHARLGALAGLSLAVVTAAAVLATQLLAPGGAAVAAAARLEATGPVVADGENPLAAIGDVLGRQSQALLRGDRAGYLRAVGRDDAALREQLDRRFATLAALRVRRWTMAPIGIPTPTNGVWRLPVDVGYCFADDDCTPVTIRVDTRWAVTGGRLRLVGYTGSDRPWDTALLKVKEGRRATVAGPADESAVTDEVLDRVLRAAEESAPVDDRFAASFDGPPRRYFVYVAPQQQFRAWYGGATQYAGAFTIGLQPGSADVVIALKNVGSGEVAKRLLVHEFGHVVTLGGTHPAAGAWWLTEGVAEYIANVDGEALRADLRSVRAYVAAGRWDGTVALGPPPADAALSDATACYGIALLGVTYLAEHYGEAKMLAFAKAVLRDGSTVDDAARRVLGDEWPAVSKAAAESIRAAQSG